MIPGWFDTHLPVLPVLVPLATAIVMLFAGDHEGDAHDVARIRRQRGLALVSVALLAVIAWRLVDRASQDEILVYRLGEWQAPYGIALVVDRLGAFMIALLAAVAIPVVVYASGGWDAHGRHFHPMLQLQLMGLSGAFVTGDIFNLFVFFEILLLASYVLMVHGQGRERWRAGVHYVALNLTASALFLVGLGLVYAGAGTLNLADLALRVPQADETQSRLLRAGGMVLLVVFAFKAAVLPMAMWLPATYEAASPPVAALFAIMTKVGVYAIWRVHGVVFGAGGEAVPLVEPWLLPAALVTSLVGVMGALASRTLSRLVGWLTVSSVGTILAAVGLFDPRAWGAALYYLANSTLVIAALFMLAELVAAQRSAADRLEPSTPVAQPVLLGLALLLAAASTVGLPPLPGFIGKAMLLEASASHPWNVPVWATVLTAGWLTLIGLARAGSILFWHTVPDRTGAARGEDRVLPAGAVGGGSGASARLVAATLSLLAGSVLLSALAGPTTDYAQAAARQLTDRAAYGRAVLGAESERSTTRPYGAGISPDTDGESPGGGR